MDVRAYSLEQLLVKMLLLGCRNLRQVLKVVSLKQLEQSMHVSVLGRISDEGKEKKRVSSQGACLSGIFAIPLFFSFFLGFPSYVTIYVSFGRKVLFFCLNL